MNQDQICSREKFTPGHCYTVVQNHRFHGGKEGIFEFYGGPNGDVAVLSDPEDATVQFAVGLNDLE